MKHNILTMEDKEKGPPEATTKQEQDPSTEEIGYQNILPSMPPRDSHDHTEFQYPAAPQALLPPYTPLQGYDQMPAYMQSPATSYPPPETGGMRSEGILPPLGHSPYSSSTHGSRTHSLLPSIDNVSPIGPPVHSHPGFGPYQASPYGYGSSGQSYHYGTGASPMMPYSTSGTHEAQTPYAASQVASGNVSPMMGVGGTSYYGSTQGYPYYGSGYSQQYEGQSSYGYYGARQRGQGYYRRGGYDAPAGRSRATNPGRPIFRDKTRSGPEGANLFVFHIPNDMTNSNLFDLFKQFGNVLSVRIMTEENTGRGRGFGFVSYDCPESAVNAINSLNGLEIQGKRLKVEIKHNDSRNVGHRYPSPAPGQVKPQRMHAHMPGYARASQSNPHYQHENAHNQSSANAMLHGDYARQSYPDPSQGRAYPDNPTSEFLPVQEARRSSHPDTNEYPQSVPPTGFVPQPESALQVSETHHAPVLPPPLSSTNQESQSAGYSLRTAASPSPLGDMGDMRKALPDP